MTRLLARLRPYRRSAAYFAAAALLAVVGGLYLTAPSAGYTATALMGDGSDWNVHVAGAHVVYSQPVFDRAGHAVVQEPVQDVKDKLTHNTAGVAPVQGWHPPYLPAVIAGRPLRYCLDEVRAFDAAHRTQIAPIVVDSIQALWDRLFEGVSSIEDCARPDLVLGANAERDCGSNQAWGCAAFNGATTRVTFNGTLRANGTMSDDAIRYAILYHETKHALDLGHTGVYGGEGRSHGHCSDMGFVDFDGKPVDNKSGKPCIEDFQDGAGQYRYGLTPKGSAPPPQPTPVPTVTATATRTATRTATATPAPTATPSPTPPPTPTVAVYQQRWTTLTSEPGCPAVSRTADGQWCIITYPVAPPPAAGAWYPVVSVRDGELHFETDFPSIRP